MIVYAVLSIAQVALDFATPATSMARLFVMTVEEMAHFRMGLCM
jgi:hypothetical protein